MPYPKTKREKIIDDYYGVKVLDPYRWLEDFDNPEVQNWLDDQHGYYNNMISKIPNYKKSLRRVKEFLSLGYMGVPRIKNEYIFYQKSTIENQPILYVQKGIEGEPKEIINPNKLSEESPIALDWYNISPSGKLIVYGLSENGDEWSILHIKNIETNEILSERIPRTRACSIGWVKDESGFYYTRYPLPGTVPKGQENYNRQVYYHKIGMKWEDDSRVFGEGLNPTNQYIIKISDDNKYLLVSIIKYTKNDLYLIDLENNFNLIKIIADEDNLTAATFLDDELWFITNKNNPRRALYKTKISKPTFENWELIIPESENILSQVIVAKEKLYVKVMKNASDIIQIYNSKGEYLSDMDLPPFCSIADFGLRSISSLTQNEFFFGLVSFLKPMTIFRYETDQDKLSIFDEIKPPIDQTEYVVKQVWYESKDKTKVSMFLAHKKDIQLNSKTPTILCGYGGFNIPLKPPYLKNSRFFWLENGGVIAIANLRGGSEYGEEWHRGGMLENKQNVFDDFIYAGKWLIENKYTSNKNLAIYGRSNGGLLTGAVVVQEPELFGAVYIGVPLLDMIRYHLFSIARYWIPEYGSSEDKKQFEYLIKYSPYHNVKKGTKYPSTFIVAAASDSRVDSNHAMKMTAAMQWANTSKETIALFLERKAGHGIGKPLDKLAVTETDLYTFLGWKTGLKM